MAGHVEVALVDLGLVAMSVSHRDARVVRHHDFGHAAIEVEGVHVSHDPGRQLLGSQGLRVDVAAGAQRTDEDLGLADLLFGLAVVEGDGLTGDVDEQLLAGDVLLAHDQVQATGVLAVAFGEPGVLEPVGVPLLVLVMQQLQGDALAPQLQVEVLPVGHRTGRARRRHRPLEKQIFEGPVVHLCGQRPAEPRCSGPPQVALDGNPRHAQRRRDLPRAVAFAEAQPQNFTNLAHGESRTWHRRLLGRWLGSKESCRASATSRRRSQRLLRGWPIWRETGGPFRVKRVAHLARNRWPISGEILSRGSTYPRSPHP
jgi:hypothetical protein